MTTASGLLDRQAHHRFIVGVPCTLTWSGNMPTSCLASGLTTPHPESVWAVIGAPHTARTRDRSGA